MENINMEFDHMDSQVSLSAEALLQHEPFVRAVVRGLLGDEDRVQDVLQETWLRALGRGPREAGSLRAWLARVASNLAKDSQRGASRRRRREEVAARAELVEPVAVTQERLEAQREVVSFVLELKEPYRNVILLRYYQGLRVTEISECLKRSPSTVRSQLSRAHEILRAGLDDKFEGGQSAWAGLLLPGAKLGAAPGVLPAAKSGWVLGSALAVGVGAIALGLWLPKWNLTRESGDLAEPEVAVVLEHMEAAISLPESPSVGRQTVQQETVDVSPAQIPDFADLSAQQMLALAVQIQRRTEQLLLTPSEDLVEKHASFLAQEGTGIARMVSGNGTESDFDHAMTKRGGGAFYSFATREHSYNAEPDLSLHHGRFSSGFYGHHLGLLLDIGDSELRTLVPSPNALPHGLSERAKESWPMLWQDLTVEDAAHRSDFRKRARRLCRSVAAPDTNSTFLLRVFSPGEHDHLVAFRPIAIDSIGYTLLWRVLKTWPVPGDKSGEAGRSEEHLEVPPGPAWLEPLLLDESLELLDRLRNQAQNSLLEIPEELKAKYRAIVGEDQNSFAPKTGFARLLHRFKFEPLVKMREGAAYFPFSPTAISTKGLPSLVSKRVATHLGSRAVIRDF